MGRHSDSEDERKKRKKKKKRRSRSRSFSSDTTSSSLRQKKSKKKHKKRSRSRSSSRGYRSRSRSYDKRSRSRSYDRRARSRTRSRERYHIRRRSRSDSRDRRRRSRSYDRRSRSRSYDRSYRSKARRSRSDDRSRSSRYDSRSPSRVKVNTEKPDLRLVMEEKRWENNPTLSERIEKLKLKEKNHTKKLLRRTAVDNDGLEELRVSLICPLSDKRLVLPSRSEVCSHIQCFDGISFIKRRNITDISTCPLCQKNITEESLYVDRQFLRYLKHETHYNEVTIDRSCSMKRKHKHRKIGKSHKKRKRSQESVSSRMSLLSMESCRSTNETLEQCQSGRDKTTTSVHQNDVRKYAVLSSSTRVSSMTSLPEGSVKDIAMCSRPIDNKYKRGPQECSGTKNQQRDDSRKIIMKIRYKDSRKEQAIQDLQDLTPRQIMMVEASQEILAERKTKTFQIRNSKSECFTGSKNGTEGLSNRSVVLKKNNDKEHITIFHQEDVHATVDDSEFTSNVFVDDNFNSFENPEDIHGENSNFSSKKKMSSQGTRFYSKITNRFLQKRDWVKQKVQMAKEKVGLRGNNHQTSDDLPELSNHESSGSYQETKVKDPCQSVVGKDVNRYQLSKKDLTFARQNAIEEKFQNPCSVRFSDEILQFCCNESIEERNMDPKKELNNDIPHTNQPTPSEHAQTSGDYIKGHRIGKPKDSNKSDGHRKSSDSHQSWKSAEQVNQEENLSVLRTLKRAPKRKGSKKTINKTFQKTKDIEVGLKDNTIEFKKRKCHKEDTENIPSSMLDKIAVSDQEHLIIGSNCSIDRTLTTSFSSHISHSYQNPQLLQHMIRRTEPCKRNVSPNQPLNLDPPPAHTLNKLFQLEHKPISDKRHLQNGKVTTVPCRYDYPSIATYNDDSANYKTLPNNFNYNERKIHINDTLDRDLSQVRTPIANQMCDRKIDSSKLQFQKKTSECRDNNSHVACGAFSSIVGKFNGNGERSVSEIARSQLSAVSNNKTVGRNSGDCSSNSKPSKEKDNRPKEIITPCQIPGTWIFVPDTSLNVDWKSFFISQAMKMPRPSQTQQASKISQIRLGNSQSSLLLSTSYQKIAPKVSYSSAFSSRCNVVSSSNNGAAADKPAIQQNKKIQNHGQMIATVTSQPTNENIVTPGQKRNFSGKLDPSYPCNISTGQHIAQSKNITTSVTAFSVDTRKVASDASTFQVSATPSCSATSGVSTVLEVVSQSVDLTFAAKDQGLLFMTFRGTMQGVKRTPIP